MVVGGRKKMAEHPTDDDLIAMFVDLFRKTGMRNRVSHPSDWLDWTVKWYANVAAIVAFEAIDKKPETLTKIKHKILTYIGSHFDEMAPDKFQITETAILAGDCPDIHSGWQKEFQPEISSGTPITKNGKGVADRLAKLFFAHIFTVTGKDVVSIAKPKILPIVDKRRSGDSSTSVDCALLITQLQNQCVFTVECKTVQPSADRPKKDSYLVHCSSPKTVGVCDAYFVIMWKQDVRADEKFVTVEDFLAKIRRIVFVTREEFARAKKLQQTGFRLTLPLHTDPLGGHAGNLVLPKSDNTIASSSKRVKKRGILQVLVGNQDVDLSGLQGIREIQNIGNAIGRWAIEKFLAETNTSSSSSSSTSSSS